MSSGFLTKKDRKSLLDAFNSEAYKKYADRIRVILLLDQGETLKNISKFLFLNEGSVVNYKKRYKKGVGRIYQLIFPQKSGQFLSFEKPPLFKFLRTQVFQ